MQKNGSYEEPPPPRPTLVGGDLHKIFCLIYLIRSYKKICIPLFEKKRGGGILYFGKYQNDSKELLQSRVYKSIDSCIVINI